MTIQMDVQPTAPSFVVGEAVTFRFAIRNTASQSVTVPDPLLNEVEPVYAVTDPDGVVTHVRLLSARARSPLVEPMAPPAVITMEIPAGGSWSEELVLDPMLRLTVSGRYEIQAVMSLDGSEVRSPNASFSIEATHVSAFGVATVPPKTHESRLFTAWSHEGESGSQIVEAVRLGRAWGDEQRGKLYSGTIHRGARTAIGEVAVAEPLFVRGMDFHGWVAWSEPGAVVIIRSNAGRAEGGADVVYRTGNEISLIGPLAMEGSYDVRLYAVERGAVGDAELIRLDIPRARGGAIKVVSRTALPFIPETAVALHGESVATVIVFAARQGNQTTIAGWEDGLMPRVTEIARLGPWINGRPLAARRSADGRVVLACLSESTSDPRRTSLFSAVLDQGPLTLQSKLKTDIGDVDPAETRWLSLGLGDDGERIVWCDVTGVLCYRAASVVVRRIDEPYADSPVPEVLTADGESFLAGVLRDGTFAIQSLSPIGHHH
jgi:hypothetical protein